NGSTPPALSQVVGADRLTTMRESLEQVSVHQDVTGYIVALATATRQHPQVVVGASPRACLELQQLARGRALLDGRDYVVPEDVKAMTVPALAHRISLRPEMWVRRIRGADLLAEILEQVPAPRTGTHNG
ncbi:MAG: AAA family ATPase, partial [Sciscionella sp.]